MASTPGFANVPRTGVAAVSTANTNRDGTGTIADILTGASSGTKIELITIHATSDPADSIIVIYRHNGTSYFVVDEFDMANPNPASATQTALHMERQYDTLYLPSNSWKLAASITAAPTAGVVNVWADGADF